MSPLFKGLSIERICAYLELVQNRLMKPFDNFAEKFLAKRARSFSKFSNQRNRGFETTIMHPDWNAYYIVSGVIFF